MLKCSAYFITFEANLLIGISQFIIRNSQTFLLFLQICSIFCSDVAITFTLMTLNTFALTGLLISSWLSLSTDVSTDVLRDVPSICP
ncbi:hypothetical protein A2U01_0048847, partial [Trifolium medium]|nr:hypothetical protein [Trifolium medium]